VLDYMPIKTLKMYRQMNKISLSLRNAKYMTQDALNPLETRKLRLPMEEIASFCHKWQILEMAIFGSYLTDLCRSDSDVDILVTYSHEAKWSLFDFMDMREELKKIFGREIDVVNKKTLEKSLNPIKRDAIIESSEVIYVSAA
jgi:hypothetical protein